MILLISGYKCYLELIEANKFQRLRGGCGLLREYLFKRLELLQQCLAKIDSQGVLLGNDTLYFNDVSRAEIYEFLAKDVCFT